MTEPETDPPPALSKGARKRRRKNPLHRGLRDVLGGDSLASQVANCLFEAGITTPEEICRSSPADLMRIPGIGRAGMVRIHGARNRLRAAHPAADTGKA